MASESGVAAGLVVSLTWGGLMQVPQASSCRTTSGDAHVAIVPAPTLQESWWR